VCVCVYGCVFGVDGDDVRGEGCAAASSPHRAQHARYAAKRMCEQAARYCRDGVHKLLNKEPQPKLREQDSKDQPKPADDLVDSCETATAAQTGNSGAQPGGIDGLVRWIVTKMSDNKNMSSREFAGSREEVTAAQEHFYAPEQRKGISVILDVSILQRYIYICISILRSGGSMFFSLVLDRETLSELVRKDARLSIWAKRCRAALTCLEWCKAARSTPPHE